MKYYWTKSEQGKDKIKQFIIQGPTAKQQFASTTVWR